MRFYNKKPFVDDYVISRMPASRSQGRQRLWNFGGIHGRIVHLISTTQREAPFDNILVRVTRITHLRHICSGVTQPTEFSTSSRIKQEHAPIKQHKDT